MRSLARLHERLATGDRGWFFAQIADKVADDAAPTGHPKDVSKATIKPLIDIDYWPAADDGLDRKRLEGLIAVMKKIGGIKADREPVKYDRLVDQSVWRDAKAMVDAKDKVH